MFSKFRARFSSAHLVALLALFVVLGGSAYAVKKNSIGTKQIKNNAVTSTKIKAGSVTTDKLADNAATGAKVDESSLGKVPSAATADTATSATTATDATNAQNATNATNAQNSANSAQLEGRGIGLVRSAMTGDTDSTFEGLDDTNFEAVGLLGLMQVPAGGGDIAVNATVDLNHGAGQHGAQCELRSDNVAISQTYTITMANGISSYTMPMTAFMNNVPATSVADPENIQVFCQGSIADDDVAYIEGDLSVERVANG